MDSTLTEAEHNDKHFIFSTKNFRSICRICFSNTKEDLQDLNLSKYENESLRNVLDSCSIHLASSQSELLPSNICMMCLKAVLQFRSFRDQLKQSNTMLKLVHDYLYNDQKPKKTSKFITISYKEYPSAEKLLNKCDLVPMYNNTLKVEQQPCSNNRTPPIIIPTTEDFTDLFNLKVLQPVSNDVPTVIFNEHHHHDNNHHDNYYTLEQEEQQLDQDIPLEYHITSEDNVVLTRSFGQQPQQQQTQMSISVSDSECNLLEKIMQVTNVKDEEHKSKQQQQQQQRKKSSSTNSTRKKQQNQRVKPTMNIHSELYIKDEVDSDDNSYGWFNVLNTNAIKQNRIKANIVGNNSKKFRKKWDCKQCCRSFRNFVLFSHHIAEDHREYYKCEICQKEFTSSTTFLRHKRLHN